MAKTRRKKQRREKEFLAFDGFCPDGDVLAREKDKARTLRGSQWWKRKLAQGVCHYCGQQFPPDQLTMDHVIPLSRGGKSTKDNVVCACKACNTGKKHNLPWEWEPD